LVKENYQFILDQIKKLRPENTPKLIAVSKKQPQEKITEALNGGIRCYGENQIKEGLDKFLPIQDKYPDLEIHHIGPVQSGTLRKLFEADKIQNSPCDPVHGRIQKTEH
jgi:uncharacterized pyridoxal phosphate-containing UPF0001 family protein